MLLRNSSEEVKFYLYLKRRQMTVIKLTSLKEKKVNTTAILWIPDARTWSGSENVCSLTGCEVEVVLTIAF